MAGSPKKPNGESATERLTDPELIYDWNQVRPSPPLIKKKIQLFDETLRDGLQSPSVVDPPLEKKLELLDLMDSVGIAFADVGLPGAGPRAVSDVTAIVKHIGQAGLKLRPACAARTLVADIAPIAEIQQRSGVPVEVYAFLGSSPIRQLAENWDLDHLLHTAEVAIDFAVKEGLTVCFVTEDTTRSNPAALDRLFRHAIEHGAASLCLCDTVGWATPDGVKELIGWTQKLLGSMRQEIRIEWHGHNDRGLAVTNALHALEAGADRVHGCALGMGERVGNAAIDLILLNLRLMGVIDWDLTDLVRYVRLASEACQMPIPRNYPLSGEDAFRTATGVHAAAIIKAESKGDSWLADRIYSGVPAGWFGKEQVIEIGPMSGLSNVNYWLKRRGVSPSDALAKTVLQRAKQSNRTLTDEEIWSVVKAENGEEGRI